MWTLKSSLPYAAGRFSKVAVSLPARRTPLAMIQRAPSCPGPGDCSPRYFALSLAKYCPHPVRIRSESPRRTSTPCAFSVWSRWAALISKPGGSGSGRPPASCRATSRNTARFTMRSVG